LDTVAQHEGRFLELSSLLLFFVGYAVMQLVEVLRYKPEGSGFDSRRDNWVFFIDLIT
jgi:hypothetical protein